MGVHPRAGASGGLARLGWAPGPLAALVTVSPPGPGLIAAAAEGLASLAAMAAWLALLLRSASPAVRRRPCAGQRGSALPAPRGRARLPTPPDVPGSLLGFRDLAAPWRSPRAAADHRSPPRRASLPRGSSSRRAGAAPAGPTDNRPGRPHAGIAFVRLLTVLPLTPAVSGSPNSGRWAPWPAPATGWRAGAAAVLLDRAVTSASIPLGVSPASSGSTRRLIQPSWPDAGQPGRTRARRSRAWPVGMHHIRQIRI